ncbi:GNAT family N-acetyltransferase [Spirillospora sp. CA-294931]|uniref:GNAT family N-acetyltransferase n=1 Tax=Spirillospora sp. CA-294931 TaxID=3240042 RepID=UPI003D8C9E55
MEIRALGHDEMELTRDVRSRSFGRFSDEKWAESLRATRPAVEAGRQLGGFEDGRIVSTARIHDLRQWWHGRAVSMGGIGSVTVAPEVRGRGLGRAMMTAVLERCVEYGHAISMLYPTVPELYRSLGWEHAGTHDHIEIPTTTLRAIQAEPVTVRRAGPGDAAEVTRLIREIHREAGDSGPIDWGEDVWAALLDDEASYCYLAEDGFLRYSWNRDSSGFDVDRVVAASERTLRGLWALVGSGSAMAKTASACLAPDDPLLWLTRERTSETRKSDRWMLRVVDAPAAIEARGYLPGVTAEASLRVDDPQVPSNSGSWRLVIKDGRGSLERAPEDPSAIRLTARGLSGLYAGVPVPVLRRAGLLDGPDAAALGAAFTASPYSLDFF